MNVRNIFLQVLLFLSLVLAGLTTVPIAHAASFGNQTVNTQSSPQPLMVFNRGTRTSILITLTISGTDFLSTSGGTCAVGYPMILGANSSCTINVAFLPRSIGAKSGTIYSQDISSVSGYKTPLYALSGTGTAPVPAASPVLSPGAGAYSVAPVISITDTTPGATVFYTLDGSSPTTASARYSSPISITKSLTLKAVAFASGFTQSSVSTAAYTIQTATSAPVLSPGAGTYAAPQVVTITDATPGAAIFYTLDGTTPSYLSPKYASPIAINKSQTLRAIAVVSGREQSAVSTAAYTIQTSAAAPVFSPGPGAYGASQLVVVTDATPGASIFYTLDGSLPSTATAKYASPIPVTRTQTLRAIAVAPGYAQSSISAGLYTINTQSVFSITGNTQVSGVAVTAGGGSVVSDAFGNYTIGNLQAGAYTVLAAKAGCTINSPALSVVVGPDAVNKNFTVSCGPATWRVSTVASVPSDVYFNNVWGRAANDVFLWGSRAANKLPEAYLAHWDGNSWRQAFYLSGVSAVSVFGTGASDVWISAQPPSGPSVVYRSIDGGVSWTQQSLPSEIGAAYIGNLTGTPNNIQASAGGNTIIRFDGNKWNVLNAGGIFLNDPPQAMTVLSAKEGYFTDCWGWGSWDGSSWTYHSNGFDFCDVSHIWASRDVANGLVLYTAGNNNFSNGVRVWKLQGSSFGSKCGAVLADPNNGPYNCGGVFAGNGSYGYATGIWGSSASDLYVTGKLGYPSGNGKVYRFDGASWKDITDTMAALTGGSLPVTTGVFGTAADDIWVPLSDGRILRYSH